ncbi:CBS domain-containing protein [Roseococcus sp. SYP-B2431]|uniref:CBS domain-containing protein n=1 Tax=Roseococcus sp. SYP-B2431 TaxID=2496640 RepID=UPI0013F47D87|nr:CBS domain-containing protein [Roseococcus sp. SYP-B2431]
MTTETFLARDLMTATLVTVPPDMPVHAIARLLSEKGISSVPVTDTAGQLLGIVTEADLLRRVAGSEDPVRSWIARLLRDDDAEARRYARTHGRTARDIMTTELVTATPEATTAHCARLMEERRIKRLPIVTADGRLVGMVSRADLLFAAMQPPGGIAAPERNQDDRIAAALRREIKKEPWADSLYISPEVADGVVTFHGFVHSAAIRQGLCVLASRIDGVRQVVDRMEKAPIFLPGVLL